MRLFLNCFGSSGTQNIGKRRIAYWWTISEKTTLYFVKLNRFYTQAENLAIVKISTIFMKWNGFVFCGQVFNISYKPKYFICDFGFRYENKTLKVTHSSSLLQLVGDDAYISNRVSSRGPDPRMIPDPLMFGDPRSPTPLPVPGAPSGIERSLQFH